MTQNRRLKKRVRERAARTGESYTAALVHLRKLTESKQMQASNFQTFTNHDFGYSLEVPTGWRSVGPMLQNSVYEVGRYLRDHDKLHAGGAIVFWGQNGDSARTLAEEAGEEWVPHGGRNITVRNETLAGRTGAVMEVESSMPNVPRWFTRAFFIPVRDTYVSLRLVTPERADDETLFHQIADRFTVIENAVPIMLCRTDTGVPAPDAFITAMLQERFDYQANQAMHQLVRIRAQPESLVATVEERDAAQLVTELNQAIADAGYALQVRTG